MNSFITGAQYFLSGFHLITRPNLRRFIIIPTSINILVFIGLFILLRHWMSEATHWLMHFLPQWLQWLSILLWILFGIVFAIIFIYTFVTIANIISAPFNSVLAEKVEYHLTGTTLPTRSLVSNITAIPGMFTRQFTILAYYLPRALLIGLLFLIPGAQPIAIVIWFLFNAWYLTFTYLDYPSDNHHIPIATVRQWMSEQRYAVIGFGAMIVITSMIPGVNFFTVPAAVAGATQFWLQAPKHNASSILNKRMNDAI